jgi:hypothetical protein
MPASEREIESAIEKLKSSPGTFQTLVERYARFTYPHRFKHIVPLGRNPNNVTVKGWPDVYSLTEDFRLCVAEATHSPDWPKHLEEDIEKAEALGRGRFSSFLFVAWDNEPRPLTDHQKPNPRYEKLAHFRARLVALDIPPDSINFVFKKQLIYTLRQPRFAGVLKEILGLSFHNIPFRLIRESQLFGPPDRPEAFAPAEKEYLEGLHRVSLADEIEKRLAERGWAWVRGRGAAGKTVLAIQIALDYESRSYPAYYLNLAETEVDVAEVLDALTTRADEQVLFIIDNVHLDEGVARDVFNHWQQVSLGSHLLLLGRDVTITDVRGTANPLEDLQEGALTLTVSPDDLAGVFHRLARRFLASSCACPMPPTAVLQRWQSLFGGDLIAFSAAVARRIRQLTQGDWHLQPQDAANYVRETYLEKASEAEWLNLLRIAVLAQLELDVPVEAINRTGIKALLQGGLVHRVTRGRDGRYEHYHLIHPGLGDLLLTAADYPEEELMQFKTQQLCYAAQQNPFFGHTIARILEAANRKQEAIAVLQSIVELDQLGITALLTSGLQYLRPNCERLVSFGLLSEAEIDQELANEPLALWEAALRTPLHLLVTFLGYADGDLPQAAAAMQTAFEQPEHLATLSQTALRTPLGDLVPFLGYAERKLPPAFAALQSALAQPEHLARLSQTALHTPFTFLVAFLNYAEEKLPQVYAALQTTLAQPEHLATLSQTALRSPLGHLAFFLDYAEEKLPQAFAALKIALTQPENLPTLSQTALRSPLEDLAFFLDYADRKLPAVSRSLNPKLAEAESINIFARTACREPFNNLLKFLRTVTIAPAIVTAIDRDEWDQIRLADRSEQPDFFHSLAKELQRLGRAELAEAPARVLISAAEPQHWHASGIGLPQLGQVMRLGHAAGTESILRFLDRIVTPAWLEQQYKAASTGAIAASLFGLWGSYEQTVWDHFCLKALSSRLAAEMKRLDTMKPEFLSAALQLLGSSALIGVQVDKTRVKWPQVQQVHEAIRFAAPRAGMTTIGYIQIQFWLGLREMARLRPDPVLVPAIAGEQILTLWKNSTGYNDKQRTLNAWMIDWLEQCARFNWVLTRDREAWAVMRGPD